VRWIASTVTRTSPQDAEARFSRGLVLVKLSRTDEAIKVFADLTRDYPQLPEPYNNLAVLYAQKGDYEKARDALEAAWPPTRPMPPRTKTSATSIPRWPAPPTTALCSSTRATRRCATSCR